jgi:dienelactone hydrolase
MRCVRLLILAFVLPAAAAETPAELIRLPEPAGVARLVRPLGAVTPPLVVLLPDGLGEDGRSEPYVDSLLARGIATLALGVGADPDTAQQPVEPAASPAALAAALGWAGAAGFDPAATGLLGFGLGGRAALAGAGGLPAIALYPGCTDLPKPSGAALVLQGGDSAAACGEVIASAEIALRLLPGAGHAWDAPGAIWPSPGPLLPDPAGGPRRQARADHAVTLLAAEAAADWFEAQLAQAPRSAAR